MGMQWKLNVRSAFIHIFTSGLCGQESSNRERVGFIFFPFTATVL